jgi:hypothetical protein
MSISQNISNGMEGYAILDEDHGSDHFNIGPFRSTSIQVVVENVDADGYLMPQVSNKPTAGWATVAFVDENGVVQADGYHVLAGQDVNHIFDLSDVAAGWMRLFYDRTSGSGSMSYYVHNKRY